MTQKIINKSKEADAIIRHHIIYTMGASMIPLLILDVFMVTRKQLEMIKQLCKLYDLDYNETHTKAVVTSLTSSTVARLGARSLVKLIPGIGATIGGVTVSIFAGASTYALGDTFKNHFETGGTILDFDLDKMKKLYQRGFKKGEDFVKNVEAKKDAEDLEFIEIEIDKEEVKIPKITKIEMLSQLKKIVSLKEDGIISEEEYEVIKNRLTKVL